MIKLNKNKKFYKLINPYMGLRREIYILALSRLVNALGALIFPFLTLLLTEKIGLNSKETGVWIAISGLIYAPASLIGGKLCDKFGRKKLLITFESLGMTTYLICIFLSPSMLMVYLLVGACLFFGIAGPTHDAMIADFTDETNRQGAYSLLYLGFNLGYAIAMTFAGLLFVYNFNLMFVIDAFTAMIALLLIGIFIKDTYDPKEVEEIAKTQISESNEDYESGSIFSVLIKRPILIFFSLAIFGYRFAYSQWGFLMPLHASANFNEAGQIMYGTLGTLNALFVVIMTPVLTSLTKKLSNIHRMVIAGVFFTIGFSLLGFISVIPAFYISVIIFTTGEIVEAISMMPYIMNRTPKTHRGRMSAVLPLVMGAGFSLGPMVIGSITETYSIAFGWYATGIIAGIATVGMVGIAYNEFTKSKISFKENATK